jgi:hypothetical protein
MPDRVELHRAVDLVRGAIGTVHLDGEELRPVAGEIDVGLLAGPDQADDLRREAGIGHEIDDLSVPGLAEHGLPALDLPAYAGVEVRIVGHRGAW